MSTLQVAAILGDVWNGFNFLQMHKVHFLLDDECIYISREGVAKIGNWAGLSVGTLQDRDYRDWAQAFLKRPGLAEDSLLKRLKQVIQRQPLRDLSTVCVVLPFLNTPYLTEPNTI